MIRNFLKFFLSKIEKMLDRVWIEKKKNPKEVGVTTFFLGGNKMKVKKKKEGGSIEGLDLEGWVWWWWVYRKHKRRKKKISNGNKIRWKWEMILLAIKWHKSLQIS